MAFIDHERFFVCIIFLLQTERSQPQHGSRPFHGMSQMSEEDKTQSHRGHRVSFSDFLCVLRASVFQIPADSTKLLSRLLSRTLNSCPQIYPTIYGMSQMSEEDKNTESQRTQSCFSDFLCVLRASVFQIPADSINCSQDYFHEL